MAKKEFTGEVSIVAKLTFCIEADSKEEAIRKLFDANCPISLVDDDDNPVCEIIEQEWHMVDEARQGNVQEPDLVDFSIEEE
ncbi:hypothetical protein Dred_2614 [Desulforamulus reducens MI-1]|uniref:Uncharacterized protein n=1 Tax=Desulforamulus reducens (strain ATCC BAA-1160 / DSM 100696 / MI-1) TaxID=349161 RepID=A4J7S1_DESRM|nr:hypothetical protein [Desulforamulus reducens]ABO51124.1 hypothetical protein Dred_2614 [Desulforamulus reducens MI-1]